MELLIKNVQFLQNKSFYIANICKVVFDNCFPWENEAFLRYLILEIAKKDHHFSLRQSVFFWLLSTYQQLAKMFEII